MTTFGPMSGEDDESLFDYDATDGSVVDLDTDDASLFADGSEAGTFDESHGSFGSDGSEGGNTNAPSEDTDRSAKKARGAGAKRWTFTWNNYPEDWVAQLAPIIEGSEWIGGYEVAETGTPHIQGYVEFPVKVRPVRYRGAPKEIHWGDKNGKPAKGTRAANVTYCTKEGGGHEGTLKVPRPLPVVEMFGWQTDVVAKQAAEPVQRRIYWYWGPSNVGKSNAVRWLVTNGALITGGSAADMKYLIVKYKERTGDFPETVVFDVPKTKRSMDWAGVEEIANGVFASTKYECEVVVMPYTRIFVFANWPAPDDDVYIGADRFECIEVP